MRIFIISNMYPSTKDHLYGIFVRNMRKGLEAQGVVFSKLALIRGRTTSMPKKTANYLRHYLHIFFLFFGKDYDLVYIHYLSHHLPVMFLLLPFMKKPWVVKVHGTDIKDLINHPKFDFFAQMVLKRVDLLVIPSVDFKAIVKKQYPFLKEDSLFVSPSGGVDLQYFQRKTNLKEKEILTLGF